MSCINKIIVTENKRGWLRLRKIKTDYEFFFRSVWYDAEYFPSSWRLDPTEGPGRVRCRLQRYHLDVDEEYLMEEYRGKSEWLVGNYFCGTQSIIGHFTFIVPLSDQKGVKNLTGFNRKNAPNVLITSLEISHSRPNQVWKHVFQALSFVYGRFGNPYGRPEYSVCIWETNTTPRIIQPLSGHFA